MAWPHRWRVWLRDMGTSDLREAIETEDIPADSRNPTDILPCHGRSCRLWRSSREVSRDAAGHARRSCPSSVGLGRCRPCRRGCGGWRARGVIVGYRALLDPEAVGKSLSAFIEITPLDPSQPDNAPELLEHLAEIEACHSIAGDASYILFVRVATPRDLEALIRDIRLAASVSTRTTVVLQTFYENRPIVAARRLSIRSPARFIRHRCTRYPQMGVHR